MNTQARIVRDPRVRPGGEGIVEMPGEILFVVSAAGVTQEGADCLEACWAWFIDREIWRYQCQGGDPVQATYHLRDLGDAAAEVETWPGHSVCYLSPAHFSIGSACGLQTAARISVKAGWRYYASTEAHMASAG